MALELNGTTGASLVQDGVLTDANMPAGSVLQAVNATYGTEITTTSSTYIDTGLTATITPSSTDSKILVFVSQAGLRKVGGSYEGVKLFRDAIEIVKFAGTTGYTNSTATNGTGCESACYLDSPASTSAVTYKTQFNGNGVGTVYVQASSATSTIILMEIAG
jgi:hypothetical protein